MLSLAEFNLQCLLAAQHANLNLVGDYIHGTLWSSGTSLSGDFLLISPRTGEQRVQLIPF